MNQLQKLDKELTFKQKEDIRYSKLLSVLYNGKVLTEIDLNYQVLNYKMIKSKPYTIYFYEKPYIHIRIFDVRLSYESIRLNWFGVLTDIGLKLYIINKENLEDKKKTIKEYIRGLYYQILGTYGKDMKLSDSYNLTNLIKNIETIFNDKNLDIEYLIDYRDVQIVGGNPKGTDKAVLINKIKRELRLYNVISLSNELMMFSTYNKIFISKKHFLEEYKKRFESGEFTIDLNISEKALSNTYWKEIGVRVDSRNMLRFGTKTVKGFVKYEAILKLHKNRKLTSNQIALELNENTTRVNKTIKLIERNEGIK